MDFDEYVAARYGRLIEHAVLLGCPEGEAGTYVDRVLIDQRRRIKRAEDPDPVVRTALEQALSGEPERRRRAGPIAAIATVGAAAVVGVVVNYQPSPKVETMPSLFGYDAPGATAYLEKLGFQVNVDRVRACEPLGQVVGTSPASGESVDEGSTIDVQTAQPTDEFCIPNYDDRVDAWAFIRFAIGGAAPTLSEHVQVDVLGHDPLSLTGALATDRSTWGHALDPIAAAASKHVDRVSGMAQLTVTSRVPPATYCGRARPPEFQRRTALRLTIDTRPDGVRFGCPLTIDLYRRDHAIDGVVVYPEDD